MLDETGEISAAVAGILAAADADIAARRPICRASGRCCRFEEWGHRLYVTGVEALHFAAVEGAGGGNRELRIENKKSGVSLPQFFAREKVEGCPYQVGGLCTAREGRPLGCRVYFCDENSTAWQNEVYEKYHAQLKAVHARFGVAYEYMEWRAALREMCVGEAEGKPGNQGV